MHLDIFIPSYIYISYTPVNPSKVTLGCFVQEEQRGLWWTSTVSPFSRASSLLLSWSCGIA